jgi:hypothetical protein
MPHRLAIALVPAFAAFAALLSASPAGATLTGPCTATLAGRDMASMLVGPLDDAHRVSRNSLLSVTMTSERPIARFRVELEFAGVRWTVHDQRVSGTRWASEVPVEDYGVYGMGLWKVVTKSEGNGFTCEAEALVDVVDDHELDPLATIAGLSGLGLALTGLLGSLAVAGRIGRSRAAPFSGLLLGCLLGVGVCVLLQQFSVVYPTIGVAGALVAAGAAFGLAFSLFGLPGRESDARQEIR